MTFRQLQKIKDPNHFIKILMWAGLVSTVLILSLAGIGLKLDYSSHIMKSAETSALNISRAILPDSLRIKLENQLHDKSAIHLSEKEITTLDYEFYKFLKPFDVTKIKVFSLDNTIIYSSDHSLINFIDKNNPFLELSLKGQSSSTIKHSGQVADLDHELRADIDMAETYVPIYNTNNNIIGSFEIYQDTSRIQASIWDAIIHSLWILSSIIFIVFFMAFFLVRHFLIELQSVQERLQLLSTKDSLTNLSNHKEIFRLCSEEFNKCKRLQASGDHIDYSVIMIDLDHFKQINDTFGHQTGDVVLVKSAQTLLNPLRSYELIGRYGGEEFMIILPSTSIGDAVSIAERLRIKIASLKFKEDIQLTASFGVSAISDKDSNCGQIIKRADDAMYQAKKLGRNRVEFKE